MILEDEKTARKTARANIQREAEREVREKIEKWRFGLAQEFERQVALEVDRRVAEATAPKNENDAAEFADRTAPFPASHIPILTIGDTSMTDDTTNETARESVLRYIGSRFDEALTHNDTIFDTPQVAMEVLEYIEGRAVGLNPDGYLAFQGADDLTEAYDDAIASLGLTGVRITNNASGMATIQHPRAAVEHLRHLADLIECGERLS